MPHASLRTSAILRKVVNNADADGDISIGEFMSILGDRAFCLAILIFSLPNSLPVPGIPGFSTITGIPIVVLALQMMAGKPVIWLPKRVANKTFSRQGLCKLITKTLPSIVFLEKYLRPRILFMSQPLGERLIGFLIFILSFILIMPIPGGNFLPGLSISLLALGLLERDGLFLFLAISFILLSLTFMIKIIEVGFELMYLALLGLIGQ